MTRSIVRFASHNGGRTQTSAFKTQINGVVMRNSLILFSFAALVAACSEQQQPTSPTTAKSDRSFPVVDGIKVPEVRRTEPVGLTKAGDARFPVVDGIRVPDAKPTDQVGFTTIEYIEGPPTTVPAGQSIQGFALCPAGELVTGGGFRLSNYNGQPPIVTYSRLIVSGPQYGWSVSINNKAAGATDATFIVNAVCVH
jgi:hypothetical protein